MSYDIRICVKVEGLDKYAVIAEPEYSSPTYNLRDMFMFCMDWNYKQGEYYKCDMVLDKLSRGIKELETKPGFYSKFEAGNGWGTVEDALDALKSTWRCILEEAEEIPLEHLYMRW